MRKYVKETWIPTGKLDVKTVLLPGVEIDRDCPNCKNTITYNLGADHLLEYPLMNEEFKLGFWCEKCDYEFSVPAQLKLKLEVYE